MNKKILALLVVLCFMLSSVSISLAQTTDEGPLPAPIGPICGDTLTTDTTLTQDLNCPSLATGFALTLDTSDSGVPMTLDCDGHKIYAPTADGIFTSTGDITIKNCVIEAVTPVTMGRAANGEVLNNKLIALKYANTDYDSSTWAGNWFVNHGLSNGVSSKLCKSNDIYYPPTPTAGPRTIYRTGVGNYYDGVPVDEQFLGSAGTCMDYSGDGIIDAVDNRAFDDYFRHIGPKTSEKQTWKSMNSFADVELNVDKGIAVSLTDNCLKQNAILDGSSCSPRKKSTFSIESPNKLGLGTDYSDVREVGTWSSDAWATPGLRFRKALTMSDIASESPVDKYYVDYGVASGPDGVVFGQAAWDMKSAADVLDAKDTLESIKYHVEFEKDLSGFYPVQVFCNGEQTNSGRQCSNMYVMDYEGNILWAAEAKAAVDGDVHTAADVKTSGTLYDATIEAEDNFVKADFADDLLDSRDYHDTGYTDEAFMDYTLTYDDAGNSYMDITLKAPAALPVDTLKSIGLTMAVSFAKPQFSITGGLTAQKELVMLSPFFPVPYGEDDILTTNPALPQPSDIVFRDVKMTVLNNDVDANGETKLAQDEILTLIEQMTPWSNQLSAGILAHGGDLTVERVTARNALDADFLDSGVKEDLSQSSDWEGDVLDLAVGYIDTRNSGGKVLIADNTFDIVKSGVDIAGAASVDVLRNNIRFGKPLGIEARDKAAAASYYPAVEKPGSYFQPTAGNGINIGDARKSTAFCQDIYGNDQDCHFETKDVDTTVQHVLVDGNKLVASGRGTGIVVALESTQTPATISNNQVLADPNAPVDESELSGDNGADQCMIVGSDGRSEQPGAIPQFLVTDNTCDRAGSVAAMGSAIVDVLRLTSLYPDYEGAALSADFRNGYMTKFADFGANNAGEGYVARFSVKDSTFVCPGAKSASIVLDEIGSSDGTDGVPKDFFNKGIVANLDDNDGIVDVQYDISGNTIDYSQCLERKPVDASAIGVVTEDIGDLTMYPSLLMTMENNVDANGNQYVGATASDLNDQAQVDDKTGTGQMGHLLNVYTKTKVQGSSAQMTPGVNVYAYNKAECEYNNGNKDLQQKYDTCTPIASAVSDDTGLAQLYVGDPNVFIDLVAEYQGSLGGHSYGYAAEHEPNEQTNIMVRVKTADGGSKNMVSKKFKGSTLWVYEPEYVLWNGVEELYPFVFESDSDWSLDVCVDAPEGYEPADGVECMHELVANQEKEIVFKIVEVGSVPGPVDVAMTLTRHGKNGKPAKVYKHKNKVGMRLGQKLAKQKGVDVDKYGRLKGKGNAFGLTGHAVSDGIGGNALVALLVLAALAVGAYLLLRRRR